mmetsp:Transcript_772/g.2319  ORF Transcript_772/g.2319 Transcript_772/m.2319 type:complete len:271 (+) Transcript_772:2191-3003(+)
MRPSASSVARSRAARRPSAPPTRPHSTRCTTSPACSSAGAAWTRRRRSCARPCSSASPPLAPSTHRPSTPSTSSPSSQRRAEASTRRRSSTAASSRRARRTSGQTTRRPRPPSPSLPSSSRPRGTCARPPNSAAPREARRRGVAAAAEVLCPCARRSLKSLPLRVHAAAAAVVAVVGLSRRQIGSGTRRPPVSSGCRLRMIQIRACPRSRGFGDRPLPSSLAARCAAQSAAAPGCWLGAISTRTGSSTLTSCANSFDPVRVGAVRRVANY